MTWQVVHGDSALVVPTLGLFHSCVTDPPYGYFFMNRSWDHPDNVAFRPEFWRVIFDGLLPGAYLAAFGGTRTFHRMACAIEDAGFVLRDTLCWLYGQGMPKSHDVSKAIDKAAGAERKVVGPTTRGAQSESTGRYGAWGEGITPTAPATEAAKRWDGYGTALSPSWEPIVLAQKPVQGTIAGNVLEHGVGGLNIDGCRLPAEKMTGWGGGSKLHGGGLSREGGEARPVAGRWPPNVACDETAAGMVDEQSGERPVGAFGPRGGVTFSGGERASHSGGYGDTGGASRFFYCPKASTAERNAGLGDEQNTHPTVKPIALMRWLTRLVTPAGGRVLDPFAGSGSGGVAAVLEGFEWVGVEREAEAVRIAKLRLHHCRPQPDEVTDIEPAKSRQPGLFDA